MTIASNDTKLPLDNFDPKAAVAEAKSVINAARKWNYTSKPWMPLENECHGQALKLDTYIDRKFNLRYWKTQVTGGSNRFGRNHHVVEMYLAREGPGGPSSFVIDAYKGPIQSHFIGNSSVINPPSVKYYNTSDFRAKYPFPPASY